MEKKFFLDDVPKEGKRYQAKILRIINDIEDSARVVEPDSLLHKETHAKKAIDARKEIEEFVEVRRDVCASFGVPFDDEHVYIYETGLTKSGTTEQRALRAFFVLIDVKSRQSFYAEGRIDHNTLFRNLAVLAEKLVPGTSFDKILEEMDIGNKGYLVFKGFVSTKKFREISDGSRKVLETPIRDKDGEIIETAEDWFVTGHNID